jgi:hypothetical protein
MQFYIRGVVFTTFWAAQMGGTLSRDEMHILKKCCNVKVVRVIRVFTYRVVPSGRVLCFYVKMSIMG